LVRKALYKCSPFTVEQEKTCEMLLAFHQMQQNAAREEGRKEGMKEKTTLLDTLAFPTREERAETGDNVLMTWTSAPLRVLCGFSSGSPLVLCMLVLGCPAASLVPLMSPACKALTSSSVVVLN
jgi:hypothetical protein